MVSPGFSNSEYVIVIPLNIQSLIRCNPDLGGMIDIGVTTWPYTHFPVTLSLKFYISTPVMIWFRSESILW